MTNGTITDIIVIAVIAVMMFFAVKSSVKHFKGEGACCGGGGKPALIKPKKPARVIATKKILIEGMTCDHCAARIQNALNALDGVCAKVKRNRGLAIVQLGRDIDDEVLRQTITDLGYTVSGIRSEG